MIMSSSNKKESILVTDDIPATLKILKRRLESKGYRVFTALSVDEALAIIEANHIDLVITDYRMPKVDGLDLVRYIRENHKDIEVIMITGYPSIEGAVKAINTGAREYLAKPFTDKELFSAVKRALDRLHVGRLKHTKILQTPHTPHGLIGESKVVKKVFRAITKAASTSETVLISGESGTGKELVAEAIHLNSERANQPFVKVNLGGISSTLFESEMFGHKKGAFTDARNDRIGRFQKADRGSIFLDEIGDLHRASQVKLLRVLQDRTFEILGSSQARQVDVRLICATNRNLNQMVSDGDFREDLYYRINLITVKLPSLRERAADIPILARHFVDNLKIIYGRSDLTVDDKALDWLKTLSWPGNIRELKNMVERTVLVSDTNLIQQKDFARQLERAPKQSTKSSLPQVGEMTLEEIEISMIQKALEFHTGNIKQVAQSLGLSRAALYRRLEKYGITV